MIVCHVNIVQNYDYDENIYVVLVELSDQQYDNITNLLVL